MAVVRSAKREKRWYRWSHRAVAVMGVVYVVVAFGAEAVPGREECFPFAAWSLFSMVPNECRDYSLRVLEVRGKRLAKPVYFEDSQHLLYAASNDGARMCIQRLGEAVARGDEAGAELERRTFEGMHLGGIGGVRYELVQRRYDPLKRIADGEWLEVRTLRAYESSIARAQ
jgi:hypothetical protein